MKITYKIREFAALLVSEFWPIIFFTIVFGAGALLITKVMITPKYESFTTMYVKNNAANADTNSNVDLNDLKASKSLAGTYIAVLKSNAVMKQVGIRLTDKYNLKDLAKSFEIKDGDISLTSIRKSISMTTVDQTEVIKISATTHDPAMSSDMCQFLTEIAPEYLIRVVGAGSLDIIDPAVPDNIPVSPNVPLACAYWTLIGFCIGMFVLHLMEKYDDTVTDSEEVSLVFQIAVFGEVQKIGAEKTKSKIIHDSSTYSIPLMTDKPTPSGIAESYKSIRSNIMFLLESNEKKVIAVSSPNPMEGKSISAANLAIVLSQNGNSVLLIDSNMRKPVQHKIFQTRNSNGLSTLIIKKTTWQKAIIKNVLRGLDLLTSGPIPPNPLELLASDSYKCLINQLTPKYDFIIIDTPSINAVNDVMVMSDLVSSIIVVLKYLSTTYNDVTETVKQLELVHANILGFILIK